MRRPDSMRIDVHGVLREAIEHIQGELEADPDQLERLSVTDVARRLLIFAIKEHRAGRGPWPKR